MIMIIYYHNTVCNIERQTKKVMDKLILPTHNIHHQHELHGHDDDGCIEMKIEGQQLLLSLVLVASSIIGMS